MNKHDMKVRISDLYAYRHEPEHVRAIANLSWRALTLLVLFGIILIGLYAIFEYRQAKQIVAGSAEVVPVSLPSITRDALQSVLIDFESRRAKFENLRSGETN